MYFIRVYNCQTDQGNLYETWLHDRNVSIENCRPWKVGYLLGFASKNEEFQRLPPFSVSYELLFIATNWILTLLRDKEETIGVGCHSFTCWFNVFVIATEKKIFMPKKKGILLELKLNKNEYYTNRSMNKIELESNLTGLPWRLFFLMGGTGYNKTLSPTIAWQRILQENLWP